MFESVDGSHPRQASNVIWNRVELPRDLESLSTGTHVLSSSQAMDWMQRVPTITAVLFEKHRAAAVVSTSLLSTVCRSTITSRNVRNRSKHCSLRQPAPAGSAPRHEASRLTVRQWTPHGE